MGERAGCEREQGGLTSPFLAASFASEAARSAACLAELQKSMGMAQPAESEVVIGERAAGGGERKRRRRRQRRLRWLVWAGKKAR